MFVCRCKSTVPHGNGCPCVDRNYHSRKVSVSAELNGYKVSRGKQFPMLGADGWSQAQPGQKECGLCGYQQQEEATPAGASILLLGGRPYKGA
eukprot:s1712_g4.t1